MRRIIALSILLLCPVTALAQEPAEKPAPKTAEQKLADLNKEYGEASRKFREDLAKLKDARERRAFMRKSNLSVQFAAKYMAIAEESPESPAGLEALLWVLSSRSYGLKGKALKLVTAHHAGAKNIKKVFWSATRAPGAVSFFRAVIKEHKDKTTIGTATFMLAQTLARSRNKEELAEAEKLFKTVKEKYGDIPSYRGTLANQADSALFKLTKLGIGCVAPDIEGEDVDGKKFKLSDYRGKVVVLDFWGDW